MEKMVNIKIGTRDFERLFEEKWGVKPGQTAGWAVIAKYKSDAPQIRKFCLQKQDAIKSRNTDREKRRYYIKRDQKKFPDIEFIKEEKPNDMRWYIKPVRIIPR